MPQENDELRSSGTTPPPGKVGKLGDPGQAPPPRGYWLVKEIGDRIARFFGLREYRGEVSDKVVAVAIIADLSHEREMVSGADYEPIRVALDSAFDHKRVMQSKTVGAVWVDDLSGSCAIHIGARQALSIKTIGQGWVLEPAETVELSITNAVAQPGGFVIIAAGYGVSPR